MHPPSWCWSRNSSRSCCVALKLNRGRWQQSWRGEGRDCAHQERQNCQLIGRMTAPNAWWVKLFFLGKNSGPGSQLQASWVNLCWQVHREAHLSRMCRLVTRMLSLKMRSEKFKFHLKGCIPLPSSESMGTWSQGGELLLWTPPHPPFSLSWIPVGNYENQIYGVHHRVPGKETGEIFSFSPKACLPVP